MERMKVTSGKYKGHIVEITGVFWLSRTVTGKLEDGTEMAFSFDEVQKIDEFYSCFIRR